MKSEGRRKAFLSLGNLKFRTDFCFRGSDRGTGCGSDHLWRYPQNSSVQRKLYPVPMSTMSWQPPKPKRSEVSSRMNSLTWDLHGGVRRNDNYYKGLATMKMKDHLGTATHLIFTTTQCSEYMIIFLYKWETETERWCNLSKLQS